MTGQSEATKFAAYLSHDDCDQTWRLRSIDIGHVGVLHKMTYPDLPQLDDVLVEQVSQVIRDQLQLMNREGEILANSDFALELPGLTFRKLRIRVSHHETRGGEASFWFGAYEGQPLAALRQYADLVQAVPQRDQVGNLAIHAIDRVLIPALNVVSAVQGGVRSTQNVEVFEDYTTRLVREADDLIMYAELVKRLVQTQQSADGDPEAREKNLGTAMRLLEASR